MKTTPFAVVHDNFILELIKLLWTLDRWRCQNVIKDWGTNSCGRQEPVWQGRKSFLILRFKTMATFLVTNKSNYSNENTHAKTDKFQASTVSLHLHLMKKIFRKCQASSSTKKLVKRTVWFLVSIKHFKSRLSCIHRHPFGSPR